MSASGSPPGTDHGGVDDPLGPDGRSRRGLRHLEWTTDADPDDTAYQVDYAILTRQPDGTVVVHHDRHVEGLFPKGTWLDLLEEAGAEFAWLEDSSGLTGFVGRRPAGGAQ